MTEEMMIDTREQIEGNVFRYRIHDAMERGLFARVFFDRHGLRLHRPSRTHSQTRYCDAPRNEQEAAWYDYLVRRTEMRAEMRKIAFKYYWRVQREGAPPAKTKDLPEWLRTMIEEGE